MTFRERYRIENAKAFRRAARINKIADFLFAFIIILCICLFVFGVGIIDSYPIAGLLLIMFSFIAIASICMLKDPDLLLEDE